MKNTIDFKTVAELLQGTGYPAAPDRVRIRIPDAENQLRRGLDFFTENRAVWDEHNYRPVVDWMMDNHGKGLLLAGECGLGKSLIGMRILPVLINVYCRKIVNCFKAQDLSSKPDEVMRYHIIYIDDIGTESVSNIYGNKRVPFSELCDLAERDGKLLIITTNCDVKHLAEKYGERTVDRLRAITKYVPFVGKSLRR